MMFITQNKGSDSQGFPFVWKVFFHQMENNPPPPGRGGQTLIVGIYGDFVLDA